ncbi:MAG: tetraether lipid synthase Tes [Candidatus Altarchaeaceae archaeon]
METKKHISDTYSLCPICKKKIPAEIYEKDNKIFIEKECNEHGKFNYLYFEDAKIYEKFKKFSCEGKGIYNPNTINEECPFSCGLCNKHKTHTLLLNIVLTNRCDFRCYYCFFYANELRGVYEPSLEQIREMLRIAKKEKPVPPNAVQLTGGNPEMRDDLIEIIKICKEEGYEHIQLNTQGTYRLWRDENFVKELRNAGLSTLYLSFDGVSKEKNPKNHYEVPYILENCRKANLGVVLVPTIINNVNDDELGKIINFALNNIDIVRGVNIQPISFVGKMSAKELEKQRITIPEIIKKIEEQTNHKIKAENFYPIPVVSPITEFVESLTNKPQYLFSTHFACGAATYIFLDNNNVVPIPEFLDVENFLKFIKDASDKIRKGNKIFTIANLILNLRKFIDSKKQPKDLNFSNLLYNFLIFHNYNTLGEIHKKLLLIGIMHFMDPYNYDVERVNRCGIHYATPDGRIIPFCTYNVLPEVYRDKIMEKYSIKIEEWEKKNNKKISDEIYKRDVKFFENSEIYKKGYNLKNFF